MPLLASSASSSSAGAGGRERGLGCVLMCGSPPSGVARCGRSGHAVCDGAACDLSAGHFDRDAAEPRAATARGCNLRNIGLGRARLGARGTTHTSGGGGGGRCRR